MRFKPEDFYDCVPYVPVFGPNSMGAQRLNIELAEQIATIANAKLEEWLKDAPVVYREFDRWTHLPPEHPNFNINPLKSTHTAKLICIEEIK